MNPKQKQSKNRMKWTMARWPLMSGVSMETIPTYGITRGIEVFVSHRYPSIPELTKEGSRKKLAHLSKFDRNIENRECVEHNEDDEPGRQCRNEPDR